jgi:G:T-mismatch repair DNA endonuclease (very short patch repair protein)
LPFALEKFPKTFGLTELKKGFCPHLFNHPKVKDYIGVIPDRKYFGSEYFNTQKKNEFDEWYNKKKTEIYDFKAEFEAYCLSDVKLLKEGCLSFRKIILDITKGIDPFAKCITIASLCHLVYRSLFMKKASIGIIPTLGFNPEEKTSKVCLQWLKYISWKNNIFIQHAKNGGEKKLDTYRLDGYSEVNLNGRLIKTGYEFNGCFWHGCPKCFKSTTFNFIKQELFATTLSKTKNRIEFITKNYPDINIVQIWECDFNEEKANSDELKHFLQHFCNIAESINPRDSLFGGRTNAIKLYHKVSDDEKINYVDFRSLYPDRQKYGIYPLGHPEIITENFANVDEYFGLVKCRVLPPKGLFHPVLPVRLNGKLFFPLCKACASNYNNEKCNHDETERSLEGTWVTLEINEAVKQGYKVLTIYEVWHYQESTQFDSKTNQGGLFSSYVNLFLKFKEEASGYPDNVNSEREKTEYIDKFMEKEGILLDKDNIKANPGIRSVMKLMLNSFWGRFGMQTNKMQVKYITKLSDWYALIEDDRFVIQDISMEIPDVLIVYYIQNEKYNDGGNAINQINVVIASFVTCQARLKLLGVMQQLGDRVIYHDTGNLFLL